MWPDVKHQMFPPQEVPEDLPGQSSGPWTARSWGTLCSFSYRQEGKLVIIMACWQFYHLYNIITIITIMLTIIREGFVVWLPCIGLSLTPSSPPARSCFQPQAPPKALKWNCQRIFTFFLKITNPLPMSTPSWVMMSSSVSIQSHQSAILWTGDKDGLQGHAKRYWGDHWGEENSRDRWGNPWNLPSMWV